MYPVGLPGPCCSIHHIVSLGLAVPPSDLWWLLSAHVFVFEWDPMRTPLNGGVRIGSHFHENACMHEQTTIGIHDGDVWVLYFLCR